MGIDFKKEYDRINQCELALMRSYFETEANSVVRLLTGNYVSIIRNRKIADMFKEAGLIEKYGTGIKRILRGFADYGLPGPEILGDQWGISRIRFQTGSCHHPSHHPS